jgi:hypothetical protein
MNTEKITVDEDLRSFISCNLTRGCKRCKAHIKEYRDNMVRCTEKNCEYSYSLYKDTILQDSKIPPLKFIEVIERFLRFNSRAEIAQSTQLTTQNISRTVKRIREKPFLESYLDILCIGGNGQVFGIIWNKSPLWQLIPCKKISFFNFYIPLKWISESMRTN